ncbi:MAG: hypothetical protein ACREEW_06415 [Caulobacteraceae bacterium]
MRKYLVAAVVGAMLIAGQAAASDSAALNLGDRIGSPSATANDLMGGQTLILAAAGALFVGLVAWGFSQNTSSGTPASP